MFFICYYIFICFYILVFTVPIFLFILFVYRRTELGDSNVGAALAVTEFAAPFVDHLQN